MIPLLFDKTATVFSTGQGIGGLPECTRCVVHEERNGAFLLEVDAPATARHIDALNVGALIVADANETLKRQAFEIYRITKDLDGKVTAYAEHISGRLKYSILKPFTLTSLTAVIARLNAKNTTNYVEGNAFTFAADFSASATITQRVYIPVYDALHGVEGSIIDVYGGCYEYDNFNVTLKQNRGADNGVKIVYGKNLAAFEAEYDDYDEYTGVFGYYVKSDGTFVAGQIQRSAYDSAYPYHRTIAVDFSGEFNGTPTAAQLNSKAAAYVNGKGLPKVSLSADVVPLYQTIEYKDYAPVERIGIDDTVTVYVPTLDVNVKAKVITTDYNVLLDRYNAVGIGNFRTTLADAIRAIK